MSYSTASRSGERWRHACPPYHTTVRAWLRHHLMQPLVTDFELDEAVAAKRCPDFARLRRQFEHPRRDLFEILRMNRLRIGHLRYGRTGINRRDVIPSCIRRMQEYFDQGNQEHLVDVANLVEIEWCTPYHPRSMWAESSRCVSTLERLEDYAHSGIRSHLVAVADAVELEFCVPIHPRAHWQALDCGGDYSLRNQ